MATHEIPFEDFDEVRTHERSVETLWSTLLQSQLSGDNGEMYLFQWLSSAEKWLKKIDLVRAIRQSANALI